MAFSIAAEIERDLISKRTKEALKALKAQGVRVVRPFAVTNSVVGPGEGVRKNQPTAKIL